MKNIAKALLQAQRQMGDAKKGSQNPYYKSTYADLNSVREACIPSLNEAGIIVLQPTMTIEGKNYVKTLLIHAESGETIESLTEIVFTKQNDAQAQGSGITYARRYGLQSLLNIGAVDDDGNDASNPSPAPNTAKATPKLPTLTTDSEEYGKAVAWLLKAGVSDTNINKLKQRFVILDVVESKLRAVK